MSDEWLLQKALLESHPMDAVRLRVEWRGPNNYTALLENFGDLVRVNEGGFIRIPQGEAGTPEGAIASLFNRVSDKTLEIVQPGPVEKGNWTFDKQRGYRPAQV